MYKLLSLSNGIRVVLFQMDSVKSVAMKAMLTAGPVVETEAQNGGSHFIEHIVLDGTKSFPTKLAFANELEELGVSYGGYTSTQEMGFEFDIPYPSLLQTISILREILFEPIFSDEIIDKERSVILEEMQDRHNSPDYQFYITSLEKRFKDKKHPLSSRVIGSSETLHALGKKELWELYSKLFVPDNLYISIVGNFNMDETIAFLEKELGGYSSRQEFQRPVFSNADLSQYLLYSKEDEKFTNVYSLISYRGFPREMSTRDELSLRIFSSMFAGLRTSRLFQDVREKEGLVYNISSDWMNSWGIGSFQISFESDASRIDRILEIVFNDIAKVKKYGFSDEELTHMKKYLNNRTLLSFSSPWKINGWLLDYIFNNEEVLFPEQIIEIGNTITHTDIARVVSEVLDSSTMNIVMMGKLDGFDLRKAMTEEQYVVAKKKNKEVNS